MKLIVTTSDQYHHILPYWFKYFWRAYQNPRNNDVYQLDLDVELVGYKRPEMELPDWCSWQSLGKQRGPRYFTNDLRPYFADQPNTFVWMMEDSFVRWIDATAFYMATNENWHKVNLTNEAKARGHSNPTWDGWSMVDKNAPYRLSTQPAIWDREYLIDHMPDGLDPWSFEKQPATDGWIVFNTAFPAISVVEGVRRHNIHDINLELE